MLGRDHTGISSADSAAVAVTLKQNKGGLLGIAGVVDVRHGGSHLVIVCSSITSALLASVAAQLPGKKIGKDYSILLQTTTE